MKKIYTFIIATIITVGSIAQTSVPAGNVSGTWTLAGSPYNVQGNISISNGTTLTIQPGVVVNFQGTYRLNVQGRLLAVGTVADTIVFTAANTTNGWKGIRFDLTPISNDSSKFIYCKIQYGNATGSSPNNKGGAFYFHSFSKTTISNCVISQCKAFEAGGAIYCNNSNLIIEFNTISNNSSQNDEGGGIYAENSSLTIANNIISNNNGGSNGGGISLYMCNNSTINSNIISNNTCNGIGGGGIAINSSTISTTTITNNIISHNVGASRGGGINIIEGFGPDQTPATISYNTISNNVAGAGGGIAFDSENNSIVSNNKICNNIANNGGAIYSLTSNLKVTNNTIANNSGNVGGAIYCYYDNGSTFTNNTIVNNKGTEGGALYCFQYSTPIFYNCIIWGNTATSSGNQIFLIDDSNAPEFHSCDVQGGSGDFELNGNAFVGIYQNNIDSLPLFVSPSGGSDTTYNGLTADWSLQSGSACINAGDQTISLPSTDIAGNPRIIDCIIDMGAYEFQTSGSLTVTINQTSSIICNGSATGTLQATAAGVGAPYTYLWSPGGSTSASISNLGQGTYTVTVTNSTGCITTATAAVTQPSLSIQISKTDVQCQGECNGSTTVLVSGQNAPFTYLWNTLSDSISLTNLCVGTYSVTITDSAGCIFYDSIQVGNTPGSISLTPIVTQAACGANDGSISLMVFPSASDYTWSTGDHSQSLYNLGSGTYWIIVSDTNSNCVITDTFNITNSRPIDPTPICMVTVDSTSSKNVIIWEKPTSSLIDSFKVYREISSVYTYLGTIAFEDLSEFTDNTIGVNPNITSYKYKLTAVDTCGNESQLTGVPHHTVHLQISAAIPQGVNLSWNDYEGFPFSQYRILRDDLGNGNWQVLDSVSFGITTYTSTDALPNARFIVEAKNPNPCISTRSNSYNSSKSNTASQSTGINEAYQEQLTISISPNPASDNITINVIGSQSSHNRNYELKMFDLLGECVKTEELKGAINNVVELSNLSAGIYFATVYSNGKTYTTKIIKQ